MLRRLFEGPASIEGRFFYNDTLDGFNFESKRALLSDVLERLCQELGNESAPALYSGSASLPIYFPGFSDVNHVRSLITAESVRESIWIGNRTCIAAHFDISKTSPVSWAGAAASPCFRRSRSEISTWARST